MSVMSGAAPHPSPLESPPWPGEDKLFSDLVVSDPTVRRPWRLFGASMVFHVSVLALIILVPLLWPGAGPEQPDYIRALLYDPPPPPPPPLPKGSSLVHKIERAKPVTPDSKPEDPKFSVQIETPKQEEKLKPEDKAPESEQTGSETGSDMGLAEGREGGVDGGVVGGVDGGQLGGVLGGTGTGPVLDYDQPPRLIKSAKPIYPQEAFVKKIEGTVVVEIVIDANGYVVRWRIMQSIPLLDAAAIQAVKQWIFVPALKHGHPVMTIANAPVNFRIF
jgi:periplasmic protein TonB